MEEDLGVSRAWGKPTPVDLMCGLTQALLPWRGVCRPPWPPGSPFQLCGQPGGLRQHGTEAKAAGSGARLSGLILAPPDPAQVSSWAKLGHLSEAQVPHL